MLGFRYTLLDRVFSGARLRTGCVFECDIARPSMAVLCMLYKIRCNLMNPHYGALPVAYVPVWVTRGALVAHRYTYAPSRCRTSQYLRTFIPLSISLWNDLADPAFDGIELAGFKSSANAFLLAYMLLDPFLSSTVFDILFVLSICWYCGAGVFGLIGCRSLSQSLVLPTSFNNNNNT